VAEPRHLFRGDRRRHLAQPDCVVGDLIGIQLIQSAQEIAFVGRHDEHRILRVTA
jgi:hypothetical protein